MRKVLAWSGVALLAMSAIGIYRWPAEAQGIDPGIAAIVNALKATLTVTTVPTTGNGWTPFLANNLTAVLTVKSSAGALGAYHCLNPNATAAYVQIFDTNGAVTLGSTVPVLSLGLPASDGGNLEWTQGIHFANGIKVAATTTATGSTALGTAVDCNFAYK
jgi:hypothetical protein